MVEIVVTGMGIVSALGVGTDATLRGLQSGKTSVGRIKYLQTRHVDLPVGEVPCSDSELRRLIEVSDDVKLTRTGLLGRVALKEAIVSSGIENSRPERVAFVSGTTVGGMEKSEQYYRDFLNNNNHNEYIALHDCGACTETIAGQYRGKFAMMTTISTACSSAANAVILGARMIRTGECDAAVVGGTECLSKFHLNGFNTLMILDNEVCRPFDKSRKGLNLGEGAAYLVLETLESANRRGVKPLCRLSGYGNACDAFHQTASSPNGDGAFLAMNAALQDAGLRPSDIDYVNAHGTGTPNNDESESHAMMRIFGDSVPPMSSTKAYTGHTTSAAGAIESVISVLALRNNFIPGNLNFEQKIEGVSFAPQKENLADVQLHHVLTNSFGFGGNDSSCIFSRLEGNGWQVKNDVGGSGIYIQSIKQISMQKPLCEDWFAHPIYSTTPYNESLDPDFKSYIPPMTARRMGRLLKRAIVTSEEAVKDLGGESLDGIITGTGLGCIENTEKFLNAMIDNDEECLQPTFFMQSTHNTVSSQIALHFHCHGYNITYSHRGTSFDSSMYDAYLQMKSGALHHILVGGHDEMTPDYFKLLGKVGYWKHGNCGADVLKKHDTQGSLSGSCSLSMLLSDKRTPETLCRISGMKMLYAPSNEQLSVCLKSMLENGHIPLSDIDAIVMNYSGDKDNDDVSHHVYERLFAPIPVMWYKHLFGESFCSSAFGVYVGAVALSRGMVPTNLLYEGGSPIDHLRNIIVFNHFHNQDYSLVLLSC